MNNNLKYGRIIMRRKIDLTTGKRPVGRPRKNMDKQEIFEEIQLEKPGRRFKMKDRNYYETKLCNTIEESIKKIILYYPTDGETIKNNIKNFIETLNI